MAIAFVQAKAAGSSGSLAPSVTLDAAPISGNLLVALITCANASTTIAITGWTAGTAAGGGSGGTTHISRFLWKISDGSEQTITGSLGSSVAWEIGVVEYSGVDTTTPNIGEGARANASGTNTSAAITPTAGKTAIAVGGGCSSVASVTFSAESFTGANVGTVNERVDAFAPSGGRASLCIFDAPITSTSSTYSDAFTPSTAGTNSAHIAIFQAAIAGTPISGTDANSTTTEAASLVGAIPGTDSGTATDDIAAKATTASDASGATTETAIPAALVTATDANGVATEAGSILFLGADANGTVTESASVVVSMATPDAATLVEAISLLVVSAAADANGTLTEVLALAASLVTPDANGGITESSAITSPVFSTDAGSTTAAQVLVVRTTVADAGAGVDQILPGGVQFYDNASQYAAGATITDYTMFDTGTFPSDGVSNVTQTSDRWWMDTGWAIEDNGWIYSRTPLDWGAIVGATNGRFFFRLATQSYAFKDFEVSWSYKSAAYGASGYTPAAADAVDIWLRKTSQFNLYVIQFDKQDGRVYCKRKIPYNNTGGALAAGIANNGIYYIIPTDATTQPYPGSNFSLYTGAGYATPPGALAHDSTTAYAFKATIATLDNGNVRMRLWRDNVLIGSWTDDGRIGIYFNGTETQGQHVDAGYFTGITGYGTLWDTNPIRVAGGTGSRADNIQVWYDNFKVTATAPASPLAILGSSEAGTTSESGSASTPGVINGSDSGSGSEAAVLVAQATAADNESATEVVTVLAKTTVADNATAADASALLAQTTVADNVTAADASTLLAKTIVTDNESTTEASALLARIADADINGALTEFATTGLFVFSSDTGNGTDTLAGRLFAVPESGAGTDSAAVTRVVYVSGDSGNGVELATVGVVLSGLDSALGTDGFVFAFLATDADTGGASESQTVVIVMGYFMLGTEPHMLISAVDESGELISIESEVPALVSASLARSKLLEVR